MNVGILTFHEIYNPGAYLQAYATRATLESLGHEARVIHYTSPNHRFRPWRILARRPDILLRSPKAWVQSFNRNAAFAKLLPHLNLTRRISTHQELRSEGFDAIVVGADIVWNYQNPRWGDDQVYFGKHLNCRRLIAYAPSCGALDLSTTIPGFVREGLARFDSIAVRDYKTAEMVRLAVGKAVPVIMDPTFDLDISRIPQGAIPRVGKYILVYAIPSLISSHAINQIRKFAANNNAKIIAPCYYHKWADINIIGANPFDWIMLIQKADFVFTNSFHGTIFSARLSKRFATEYNVAIKSKTQPVIEKLQLQDHVFTPNSDLSAMLECVNNTDLVAAKIRELAQDNQEFLSRSLALPS